MITDEVQKSWFARLSKLLRENVSKNDVKSICENVTAVSLNYDRCIEHYLHEELQAYYALDHNAVTDIMKEQKSFHPYGSVGKLPWQESIHTQRVPYGAENYNVVEISKQIKTFNETVDEKAEIEKIAYQIREAKIIVFLGFAVHEQNLKLIDSVTNSDSKRVYATALGGRIVIFM